MKILMAMMASICVATTSHADQLSGITSLLNSFGNGCSIYGRQSQLLVDTTRSLNTALRNIIADDDCKSLAMAATDVQGSIDRMSSLSPQYSSDDLEYQRIQARRDALVTAIRVETDLSIRERFENDLRNLEIDLVDSGARYKLELVNEKNRRIYEAATSYQGASESLLRMMAENQNCFQRHRGLADGIGNVGLALAQSSTLGFATSGASLIAGAGIHTISNLIRMARDRANAKQLRSLSDPLLPTALSCALENLNTIYCESDKIEKLGTYVLSSRYSDLRQQDLPAFSGLELMEKALPSLDTSLTLIKIGNDPSSASDAANRKGIRLLTEDLQGNKLLLVGFLADLRREVAALPVDLSVYDRRKQILRTQKSFVNSFLNNASVPDDSTGSSTTSSESSLYSIYPGQKARYFLMGFDPLKVTATSSDHLPFNALGLEEDYKENDEGRNPWKKYYKDEDSHFIEDIGQFEAAIQRRFERWYNEALNGLNSKRNLILKTDKKEILASLERPISRDNRLTSTLAITQLSNYFKNPNNLKYLSEKDKKIAREITVTLDDGVIKELNSISFDKPDDEFNKIANQVFSNIMVSTQYVDDPRYLINRISVLVSQIITEASIELYRQGKLDFIYALASTDTVKELLAYAGKQKSTADLVYDSYKTKGQTVSVIAAFADAFEEPLKKSLEDLTLPQNLVRRSVERGHLCLQLLGLEPKPKSKIGELVTKYCMGATIPKIDGVPDAPVFTLENWQKPVEDRICLHQNWRRRINLFEKGIDF